METTNPFQNLVTSASTMAAASNQKESSPPEHCGDMESQLEGILRVSVDQNNSKCVYLQGMAESNARLVVDRMNEAVFERLMMDPEELTKNKKDCRRVMYLYGCYQRSFKAKLPEEVHLKIRQVVIEQAATCLMNEAIYPGSVTPSHTKQLELLVLDQRSVRISDFVRDLSIVIDARYKAGGEEVTLKDIIQPTLLAIAKELKGETLISHRVFPLYDLIQIFRQNEPLALALLQCQPKRPLAEGRVGPMDEVLAVTEMNQSLFGAVFGIGCLGVDHLANPWGFFEGMMNSTMQDVAIEEQNVWMPLRRTQRALFEMIEKMLRISATVRLQVLDWIGYALELCSGRSKLGSNISQISHNFAINLLSVLMKLSLPFCKLDSLDKVLKVDFTYPRWAYDGEVVHLRKLEDETTLLPRSESYNLTKQSFVFPTECFFAVHKAIVAGSRVLHERLMELNKEISRLRTLYDDSRAHGFSGQGIQSVEMISTQLNLLMSRYQCMRTTVFEPDFYNDLTAVCVASAHWLAEVANRTDLHGMLPIDRLTLVPEFLLENISDTLVMTKRFSDKNLSLFSPYLSPMLRLITTFMGSPDRVKNPHLRAKLAEMLEALLICTDADGSNPDISNSEVRVLLERPVSDPLAESLINVFVSIETNQQSVSFEEKFQYRRPMYLVLEQLWKLKKHRTHMEDLSEDAIRNISDPIQPLFLRFSNLLINDANYLLYESFQQMQVLKTLEKERAGWQELAPDRRMQNEANFRHQKMLARFHNVMSRDTIHTLTWLASSPVIRRLFLQPILVEPIATMLNFFLLHLVGPEQKNLRVQNLSEYDFRPAILVESIARTYVHLAGGDGEPSDEFYQAIVKDQRSYKPELFVELQNVLGKTGRGGLVMEIESLRAKLTEAEGIITRQDELTQDAPEEFTDPLLFTMMTDPVILPTSNVTVDRNTIARHLLSDPTDPFNRQPLSLDMVTPNVELKKRIDDWLREARKS